MARRFAVIVALLLAAAAQWPQDARSLLAWHAEQAAADRAAPPTAAALRERLYVYVLAGAEAQAWQAADRLEALAPGDADGGRYRAQLSAWDPDRWETGIVEARDWGLRHAERSEAERASVAAALSHLEARLAARAAAHDRQHARVWAPWAAALLVGCGMFWIWRRAGRGSRT